MKLMTWLFAATILLFAQPARADPSTSGPFAAVAVSDAALAASYGTGGEPWTTPFRFSDQVLANVDRQSGSLPSIIRDVWSQEVAGPFIAANAARAGLLQ